MHNEISAVLFLYQLIAIGWAVGFGLLLVFSFFWFWYVHGDRREKKLSKKFALIPTLINNKFIWLKFYIQYQEFSPGICLGGTINLTYSGRKDRYVSWNGSGSFIPSYNTIYKGYSIFGIRSHLKKDGFIGVVRKKREQAKNLNNLEQFFSKEAQAKWQKRAEAKRW